MNLIKNIKLCSCEECEERRKYVSHAKQPAIYTDRLCINPKSRDNKNLAYPQPYIILHINSVIMYDYENKRRRPRTRALGIEEKQIRTIIGRENEGENRAGGRPRV